MSDNKLKKLRAEIDKTDKKLVELLTQRFRITKKVGEYKKARGLKACDPKREAEIFKERAVWAEKMNLDSGLSVKIFKMIIGASKKKNREILKK